jgi:putative ABC transport system permease protein
MNLVHIIVRQWRQRPARTLLSILSVAIAVAAVFGVALAQAGVRLSYRKLLQAVEGRPALEILSASGGRFSVADVPRMTDIPGVLAEIPIATRATLARVRGKRLRAVLLGIPAEQPEVWKALVLVEGVACRKPDEAIVAAEVAQSLKIQLGDRITVLTRRGPRTAKAVGFVESGPLREFAPAATLAMPLAAVQEFFDLDGRVDRVRVLVESTHARARVQAELTARLPDGFVVQAPVDQVELVDSILRSTELALRFAGALTMAMAAFIILNTLRMNFGERRRDVAVLRVLGVTQGQLVGLHLMEGICLGLIGSVVGIPFGLALGRGLEAVMQRLVPGEAATLPLSYWTLPTALVVGPLVACAAALLPALKSRRVSPAEALGDTEARRGERFPLWAVVLGVVVWLVAAALLLAVVFGRLSPEAAIPSGVLMLVGFLTVIPALLGPVIRATDKLLAPWTRVEGSFAAEQLLGRPTRTGLTVGVLVAAVSTSLGMGNAILNNVDDVRAWYRRTMSGDLFLTGGANDGDIEAGDRKALSESIAAQPGVGSVVELRYLPTRAGGLPAGCILRGFPADVKLPWVVTAEDEAHTRDRLRAGNAVVGSVLAKKLELSVGDTLRLELQGRILPVPVGAVVRDYTLGGMVVFLDHAAAAKLINVGPADIYIVQPKPGAPREPLLHSLEALASENGLVVRSFAELRRQLDGLIDGIVGALWGLVGVGFVIGGVAVANTLTMSVLEQTRELGLLRIIGMTRGQVRKLVFCESLLMGILGTLMGIVAGMATAWNIHVCNEPLLGQAVPFALHGWLVAVNMGTCLAISLVAAWSPGRRAARLNLLSAIAYE